MKKTMILLLCVLLLVPFASFADDDPDASARTAPLLVDEGDLLTEAEEIAFEEELERISAEQKCDVIVLIPASLGYKSATEYADDWYDDHNYGYGQTKNGILLLVCMEERDWATSTAGAAQDWFDDDTLTKIEDAFLPKLSDGDYLSAFVTFSTRCERVLQNADRREVLYLDDAAGLLTGDEADAVTRKLESYSHVSECCDIAVLTAASLGGQTAEAYAQSVFGSGVYLHDASYDRIVLVVDLGAGKCYCVTEGLAGNYFSDDDLRNMESDAAGALSSGSAVNAFMQFGASAYSRARGYYESNIVSYDVRRSGFVEWFSFPRLFIAVVAGLIAALSVTGAMTRKLKSVKKELAANRYLVNDSFRLSEQQDLYLYSNVTKTVRQTDSGSGRSGGGGGGSHHFSSGGVSHGGHSGKF